jgi:hypothetical protein
MKYLIIIISLIFFSSCEQSSENTFKYTSVFELRQLVKETENVKTSHGSFFLIGGSYNSDEYSKTNVKVFAKVNGAYRFVEIPIEDIRIVINDSLTVPTLQVRYKTTHGNILNDDQVLQRWCSCHDKSYIITCPEKYLPEKLLPIEL